MCKNSKDERGDRRQIIEHLKQSAGLAIRGIDYIGLQVVFTRENGL